MHALMMHYVQLCPGGILSSGTKTKSRAMFAWSADSVKRSKASLLKDIQLQQQQQQQPREQPEASTSSSQVGEMVPCSATTVSGAALHERDGMNGLCYHAAMYATAMQPTV